MPPSIARVAVPSPLRRLFDYLLPGWPPGRDPAGCRVRVPFGSREVTGVVLGMAETSSLGADRLRPVLAVLDESPVIRPDLLLLCNWAASYYHHAPGDVLATALPVLLRQGEPARRRCQPLWRATGAGMSARPETLKRAPRQAVALGVLQAHPEGILQSLACTLELDRNTLAGLQKRGYAEVIEQEILPAGPASGPLLAEAALSTTPAQAGAIDAVRAAGPGFHAFLLEGVTGSGKTEVYLQLAGDALAAGLQVLVLVPEIGLTPQTVERFRRRFNRPVVVLHSGLTDRERLDAWLDAAEGRAGIILGTRSAVFTPLLSPGLIVIDEEHDASFKQQEGFRYHARDLAVLRARHLGIPVLLGSATPALESLQNAATGKYRLLALPHRAGGSSAPRMELIDIRRQRLKEGIGESLLAEMRDALQQGNQVLLFLNRRGFSPVLLCHDCGWTADCRRCDARYTLHQQPAHLHCHHCGSEARIPRTCPSCGSTDLVPVGLGTERVEQALATLLPKEIPVLRLDSDTVRRKQAWPSLLARVQAGKPLVLVGTQMLAKGHHFPHVTLAGILDADSGLLSADFRAPERLAQLLVQVAGRAGRAGRPGRVLVQTHCPDHPLLQRLAIDGYDAWAREALRERQAAALPPFTCLALFRAEAARDTTALDFLENLKAHAVDLLADSRGDLMLMGPAPAPMARRGGRFRAQLLVQATDRAELHRFLSRFVPRIEADPESRRVRWSVDVDPLDLY